MNVTSRLCFFQILRLPLFCLCIFTTFTSFAGGRVVFLIAEDEYRASESLPVFAKKYLPFSKGWTTKFLIDENAIFNMKLTNADLLVLYVRRRALPVEAMQRFRDYLNRGKPLLALRTSSHAWDTRQPAQKGLTEWESFDAEVLGGNYHGHHGRHFECVISIVRGMENHSLFKNVSVKNLLGKGSLYKVCPLKEDAQILLMGRIPHEMPEPILWRHRYGKAQIIYTSLGHSGDFAQADFNRLLFNCITFLLRNERSKS